MTILNFEHNSSHRKGMPQLEIHDSNDRTACGTRKRVRLQNNYQSIFDYNFKKKSSKSRKVTF